MRLQPNDSHTSFPVGLQYCAGLFCLVLSMIVVACSGGSGQYVPVTPQATITIVFGQHTPTPPLHSYYCGGWATDTTPGYNAKGQVVVYGKFTHTLAGNPVGVGNASAVATVLWPDGTTETEQETTSSDGLAVFTVHLRSSALNHLVQIQMGSPICDVEAPAKRSGEESSRAKALISLGSFHLPPGGEPFLEYGTAKPSP
jgi:hypothetical protein